MRAEAFGEIGLLPSDFHRMMYKDYLLLQKGFMNKRKYEQRILRRAVTKLLQPYMDKSKTLSEYQIWPVDGDDILRLEDKEHMTEVSEKSLARLRAMKEKEKNQKSKEN
jgi:hypothetical protein